MLKGLKSVDRKIIQMYHFLLKWKRYTVCTNWWDSGLFWSGTDGSPGLEVIKLEFILRLKIKRNDWLFADTCPQAANHCALF